MNNALVREAGSRATPFWTAIRLALWVAGFPAVVAIPGELFGAEKIDFNRDVRPILSDNCFACHGFDENARKADLRLDEQESALADLGGYAAIVAGKPAESAVMIRVLSKDPNEIMPPADSHKKPLPKASIEILRQWIAEGAVWGRHWSFVRPQRPKIPEQVTAKGTHPIDYFVQQRLEKSGLALSPRATTATLARRLSFDLTGLPPTTDQLDSLGDAPNSDAWKAYVDELFASPHFGERMAMWWLDDARYSDTDGFQSDAIRNNWPWRDWVTSAFNQNMTFDQFTIEQFAGDLLPNATPEQKLATCFHRNHMTNGEGGRDPAESRVDYVRDRVNTTGTVFLGITFECAQCHSHKFDPLSHAAYYEFSAFFNSIDEDGKAGGGAKPFLPYKSPHAQRAVEEETALLKRSQHEVDEFKAGLKPDFEIWFAQQFEHAKLRSIQWSHVVPGRLASVEGSQLSAVGESIVQVTESQFQDDYVVSVDQLTLPRIAGIRLEVFPHENLSGGGLADSEDGEFILTNFKLRVRQAGSTQVRDIPLTSAVSDFDGKAKDAKYAGVAQTLDDDPRTGWTTRGQPNTEPHRAVFALESPLTLRDDETLEIMLMHRSLFARSNVGRFRLSISDQAGNAVRSVGKAPLEELHEKITAQPELGPAEVDAALRDKFFSQFLEDNAEWKQLTSRHRKINKQLANAKSNAKNRNVMVLVERATPRETHVLLRGVWDAPGEPVQRAVPSFILERPNAQVPTRLELAQWIVSPENPLTARVITNQVWQLLFGAGLVRTPGDFGRQGEHPTHPELLDWLAVDFVEHNWDVQHLIRTIVTSDTYRQSSAVTPQLLELDPDNRLLARGARFRLPSWMIRDSMLRSSGLLNPALGGAPVFPHQPDGVWRDQFMGRFTYQPSLGPAQYRRTLYTFWRRTSGPTFLFDSSSRRRCEVIPRRTNTPLQALAMLNDRTILEAARELSDQMIELADYETRATHLWKHVLSREPRPVELDILQRKLVRIREYYQGNEEDAKRLLHVGERRAVDDRLADRAALMIMANLVLNLDEAITHE